MSSRYLSHGRFIGGVVHQWDGSEFVITSLADDPSGEVAEHSHETAHFCVVLRGSYLTEAQGLGEVCGPGSVLYHPPGTTHSDRFLSPNGLFMTVALQPRFLGDNMYHEPLPRRSFGFADAAVGLVASRIADATSRGETTAKILRGLIQELLGASGRLRARSGEWPMWLKRSVEAIRATHGPVVLSSLARDVGVHPVTLTRGFRRFLGTTPSAFGRGLRIERARRLLLDTELSLSAIAHSVGFADQSHMTRECSKTYGRPPGQMVRGGGL